MSYINKREEFENQNSGRHLFKTDPEMFTKIKDNTFGFWSLSPLSNFNKDAYKTDQIHMNPQYGDKPLDYLSSCEAEVVGTS